MVGFFSSRHESALTSLVLLCLPLPTVFHMTFKQSISTLLKVLFQAMFRPTNLSNIVLL